MGEPRFALTWQLRVEHDEPTVLAEALEPESRGFLRLSTESGRLVAEGAGDAGTVLHTLDDVLACLTAAMGALGQH